MPKIFKTQDGFTMIEIISVLVILGILVAVVASRMTNYDVAVYTGADALKAHLRYAQTMAMNKDPNTEQDPITARYTKTVMGIKYDAGANKYWLFKGIAPDVLSSIILLPDDSRYITSDRKIDLAAKKITFGSGFTIYFDDHGIPYTVYTDSTTNTPLASLSISVTSLSGGSSNSVTITPLTGFIP